MGGTEEDMGGVYGVMGGKPADMCHKAAFMSGGLKFQSEIILFLLP